MLDTKDTYTVKEVAKYLGCSVRTIWRLIDRGTIGPPMRLSPKLIRFTRAQVEGLLKAAAPVGKE